MPQCMPPHAQGLTCPGCREESAIQADLRDLARLRANEAAEANEVADALRGYIQPDEQPADAVRRLVIEREELRAAVTILLDALPLNLRELCKAGAVAIAIKNEMKDEVPF